MDSETTKTTATSVRFGPHPTDEMRIELAEKVLTALREYNDGVLFGRFMLQAHGIETRKRAR